jgi:hypothetical protein
MFYLDEEYEQYEDDLEIEKFITEIVWFFLI